MKELLLKHFTSVGFKKRFVGIYLPFIKTIGMSWYNKMHVVSTDNWYKEQMGESEEALVYSEESEADSALFPVEDVVLSQEDAIQEVKQYLFDHEYQVFGMCVTHTVKNLYRFATHRIFGGMTDYAEHDIYIDRGTRNKDIDGGMSSTNTLARIVQKGVAIHGTIPDPVTKDDLNITRENYPDDLMQPLRIKLLAGSSYINANKNFNRVWAYITNEYKRGSVRPFQMSITARRGWWQSDVPKATGKVYGGHSLVGLTIPFMYKGKRAFFCIDSAYRKGLVWKVHRGVRIVTEDCWNGLGRAIRPVRYISEIEQHLGGKPATVPKPGTPPSNGTIPKVVASEFGEQGTKVTDIQVALIKLGYDLPAITKAGVPYGYYGTETANAVLKWQLDNQKALMRISRNNTERNLRNWGGRYFGNSSVSVMNNNL